MKRYYDKQWDSMFQRLLEFKQNHGHCNVVSVVSYFICFMSMDVMDCILIYLCCLLTTTRTTYLLQPKRYPDNLKLGTWVHTQRIQYRKLVSGNNKGSGKDKTSTNGTSSPTTAIDPAYQYTEENASEIAAWSAEQAQSYRLTDERRKRLEEVGFCWSAREGNEKSTLETSGRITRNSYDDQWDAMFDLLIKYKEQRGDCLVVSFLFSFSSWCTISFI
jgi:hypothetical protein